MLRGVLAIIFGVLAIANPAIAAATLVWWLGIFILIDGTMALVTALNNWNQKEDKWLLLLDAVISIILGILIFRTPGVTLLIIEMFLAVWAIFSGVTKIAMAIQLRKQIEGEGWLALSGLLSIIFGILIFAQPGIGVVTLMWLIAVFAIMVGAVLILLGLRIRKLGTKISGAKS